MISRGAASLAVQVTVNTAKAVAGLTAFDRRLNTSAVKAQAAAGGYEKVGDSVKTIDTKKATGQLQLFDSTMAKSSSTAETVSKSYDKVGASSKTMGKDVSDTDVHVRKASDGFQGFSKNAITASAVLHLLSKAVGVIKWPAMIAAVGYAAEAVAALAGGVVALTGALAPLSGALASAGSGLILFGQVKATLALTGIKDVTSAVGGLNEKLDTSADAFKKLSPEAQKFAQTLQDAKKPIRELQAEVQKPMFTGLDAGLNAAMKALPAVEKVLRGTAQRMGNIVQRLGEFVGSKGFAADFAKVGKTNNQFLARMGKVIVNLAHAFMDVVTAARPLTEWFGKLFQRWSEGAKTAAALNRKNGDLAKFFGQTQDVIQDLIALSKNLFGALLNLGKAGAPLGRMIIDKLVAGSRALKEWTESASGRNSIAEFFKQIKPPLWEAGRLIVDFTKVFFSIQSKTSGALAPLLKQLRTELLPMLGDLISSTTKAFGPRLVDLLTQVARLMLNLAGTAGPLNVFVTTLSKLAEGLNWLIEHVPGMQTVVVTLLSFKAINSVLSFTKITAAAEAFTAKLVTLGTTAKVTATEVTTAQKQMAAGQFGATTSGLGMLPTSASSTSALKTSLGGWATKLSGYLKGVGGRLGAGLIGGIASQMTGDAIGGVLGQAVSDIGTGASIGYTVGGPWGAAAGAIAGGLKTLLSSALGDALSPKSLGEKLAENAQSAARVFEKLAPALVQSSKRVRRTRSADREATADLRQAEERLMKVRDKYPANSKQVVSAEHDVADAKHRSEVAGERNAQAERRNTIIRNQTRESAIRAVQTQNASIDALKEQRKEAWKWYIQKMKRSGQPPAQVEAAFTVFQQKSKDVRAAVDDLDGTIADARESLGPKFARTLRESGDDWGKFERKLVEAGAGGTDAFKEMIRTMAAAGKTLPRNLIEKAGLSPAKLRAAGAQIVNVRQNLEGFTHTGAGKLFQLTDKMKREFGSVATAVANMGKKQRDAYKAAAKQAVQSGAITENEYDRLMKQFRKAGEVQRDSWKKAAKATGESTRDIKRSVGDMTVRVSKDYEGMVKVSGGGIDWLMSKTGSAMKSLGVKKDLKWVASRGGKSPSEVGHVITPRAGAAIVPGVGSGDKVPLHLAGEHVANVEPGELVSVVNRRATDRLMQTNAMFPRDGAHNYRKGGEVSGGMTAALALAQKYEQASYPYQWGGGHGGFPSGTQPVDCSGAVSDILHAAGLLDGAPMVSGALMSWGQQAKGNEPLVVYANPEHTVMSLNGKTFGTSQTNPGGGAGWIEGASGASLAPGAQRTMPVEGGAMLKEIPRLLLKQKGGIEAAMHHEGQGALDKTWKSANALLARLTPTGSFGGGDSQLPGRDGIYTASWYGPTPATVGAAGVDLRGTQSFAELSNDPGSGVNADFGALGGLPMHYKIGVTYKGKTVQVEKLDVGAGGAGLNGHIRAVDLWEDAAKRLPGFQAAGIADVEVSGLPGKRKGGLVGPQRDLATIGKKYVNYRDFRRSLGLQDGGVVSGGTGQPTGGGKPTGTAAAGSGLFIGEGTATPSSSDGTRSGRELPLTKLIKRFYKGDEVDRRKITNGVKDKLLKLVKDKHFPVDTNGEFVGRVQELRHDADKYGEYASYANTYGDEFQGASETEWLTKQLQSLLSLRNALIRAEQLVTKRRKEADKVRKEAHRRAQEWDDKVKHGEDVMDTKAATPSGWDDVDPGKDEIGKWNDLNAKKRKNLRRLYENKHGRLPGDRVFTGNDKLTTPEDSPQLFPNLDGLKATQSFIEKIVEGTAKRMEPTFNDALSTIRDEITTVQGTGFAHKIVKRANVKDAMFGGEIFDVQMQLKDIAAENAPKAITIDDLRSVIEAARFGVFDDLPKFHTGGVVPGPANVEVPIMARGGEVVSNGAPGDVTVVNNFSWDSFGAIVETEVNGQFHKRERIERHAGRQF